jgi:hypothetical protein
MGRNSIIARARKYHSYSIRWHEVENIGYVLFFVVAHLSKSYQLVWGWRILKWIVKKKTLNLLHLLHYFGTRYQCSKTRVSVYQILSKF